MAITEIHPITATIHKAIAYICNQEKTDDKLLVSSFGCSPETAHFDFSFTRQNAAIQSQNLAHHLIQAFKPGEVSPEEAHQIGKELADRLLKDKYSYVLTTHIDKGHIHNHLIFNAVDNEKYEHYNDCKKTYYHIRDLSDELCKEHNLSVIEEQSGQRGKSWYEWKVNQEENGWKQQMRRDINKSIQLTDDFEEFLAFMRAKGYQIKLGKYISFCAPGKEKFVRGSAKSLGKNYTIEKIQDRLRQKPKTSIKIMEYRLQYLIHMSPEMLEQEGSSGLKSWMTRENLKRAAETYNQMVEQGIYSIEELDNKINNVNGKQKDLKKSLKEREEKSKDLRETIKYLKQYQDTEAVYKQYKQVYFRERFFQKHERDIIIYGAAKNYLKEQGIDPEKVGMDRLGQQLDIVIQSKETIKQESKNLRNDLRTLQKMKDNLQEYLQMEAAEIKVARAVDKEH